MPTLSLPKRLRMITFRVSDEEYESLKSLYPTAGARSVSELARIAIARVLQQDGAGDHLAARIEDIEFRLGMVNRELARLSRALDGPREEQDEKREGFVNA